MSISSTLKLHISNVSTEKKSNLPTDENLYKSLSKNQELQNEPRSDVSLNSSELNPPPRLRNMEVNLIRPNNVRTKKPPLVIHDKNTDLKTTNNVETENSKQHAATPFNSFGTTVDVDYANLSPSYCDATFIPSIPSQISNRTCIYRNH
ncbi:unnamed protein product [Heterobilharzia americana]|nr:unnamed protein product [Heterobilharzia americana]